MGGAREALYGARAARVWPGLDDKSLTAWNAMMLRSFAEAGRALGRADYIEAAARNAEFVEQRLHREGKLLRSYRAGEGKIEAFLDDHALFVDALVSLYMATADPRWVSLARRTADAMLDRFWSEAEGAFYDTAANATDLVVRPREINDSATPSGTSAAATALLRLNALTGEGRYVEVAERVLQSFAEMAPRFPQAFGELLAAMDLHIDGVQEVAIVGAASAPEAETLREVIRTAYHPRTVVAFLPHGMVGDDEVEAAVPLLQGRTPIDGAAAAYVCRSFACRMPVTTPEALRAELADEG